MRSVSLYGVQPGWGNSAGALAAAVQHVNADPSVLSGWLLEYRWSNSGCSASEGLKALGSLIKTDIAAVIGPACSIACDPTGFLTAGVLQPPDL